MPTTTKKWPTAGFPQGTFVKEEKEKMIKLLLKFISLLKKGLL
jgi:hypothetical protein